MGRSHGAQSVKCDELPFEIEHTRDWPQHALREDRTVRRGRERQDPILDVGREVEEHHDLGEPGTGDAFPVGNLGAAARTVGVISPA